MKGQVFPPKTFFAKMNYFDTNCNWENQIRLHFFGIAARHAIAIQLDECL